MGVTCNLRVQVKKEKRRHRQAIRAALLKGAGCPSLFPWLDAEPLAALCTTGGKDCTSAAGGHTGTKAVALGALPLVRLIGTLHSDFLPLFSRLNAVCCAPLGQEGDYRERHGGCQMLLVNGDGKRCRGSGKGQNRKGRREEIGRGQRRKQNEPGGSKSPDVKHLLILQQIDTRECG